MKKRIEQGLHRYIHAQTCTLFEVLTKIVTDESSDEAGCTTETLLNLFLHLM